MNLNSVVCMHINELSTETQIFSSQFELEKLNAATDGINHLETEYDVSIL